MSEPPGAIHDSGQMAYCGQGRIDGMCWRPGDAVKHLGPPKRLAIPLWSRLWQTRCGLGPQDGHWQWIDQGQDDDCWCPKCIGQAGMAYWFDAVEEEPT